jgi:hypothetical protein
MRVVKVEVTREDGTVSRLTGDDAARWDAYVWVVSRVCTDHGVKAPELAWKDTPPPQYVPAAWCAYCAEGGPHVPGVTPCPICARVAK